MAREGGVRVINRKSFKYSIFPPINIFLKDSGPLKSKKRFWTAKQLYVGRYWIKGRALFLLILHNSGCRRIKIKSS